MQRKSLLDVPIDKAIPYENNPRFNDKGVPHLIESIRAYGYMKTSIGVDENMVLLFGHTTLKALKELQWPLIPEITQFTGLTEAQKRGYRIADNKTSEYSGWDFVKLIDEMEFLQEQPEKIMHDATGFGDAILKSEKFNALDKEVEKMDGITDAEIVIIVPKDKKEAVVAWLAFGAGGTTAAQIGQGVMRRCGLL
jgi:hypothetical protein